MSEHTTVSGWSNCRVGDLCLAMVNGGTPSTAIAQFWEGTIPWVTGADFGPYGIAAIRRYISPGAIRRSATNVLKKGTILFVTRTGVGKIAIAQHDIAVSQDITGLIPNEEKIDSKFMYYILCREVEALKKSNQGTSINGILRVDLEGYGLYIPIQISEQRKIARILTTLDDCIEQTEALIAKYQAMKEGLMHDLFTRGIGEDGGHGNKDASGCGYFPSRWPVRPLSQVADIGSGVTLGRKVTGPGTVELPYIRVANVQAGQLDLQEVKTVRIFEKELPGYLLQQGDLLLTEGGDFDKLGRGTLWRGEIPNCIHQNHIFRVRPNNALVLPEFLELVTSSYHGRMYFLRCAKQTTNLASINSTQLKSLPVPCPTIEEQRMVVNPLHALESCKSKEMAKLEKLRKLKSGLMHALLTGKTRVTPNP